MSAVRHGVARHAYSLLLSLLTPAYLLKLWWRGREEPPYRHAIAERLGRYPQPPSQGWVWVHAVSLGETRAAASLVAALREQLPGMRLLLTHGTATGREAGQALLQPGDVQTWLPYDTPAAVRRFFAQFRPAVGVLMETEVWPNLLHAARAAGVPMVLANARLSEKSLRRGQRLAALMRPAVEAIDLVLAQTPGDAARLRAAGAAQVEVCGNLKFDMSPAPELLERGRRWRAALGERAVVLAASTREGEEAPLLAAWQVRSAPRPLLLLVPRHPQRFDEVAQQVRAAGLRLARRSETAPPPADADVWLGDSIGEMPAYYAAADVALLGGSFAPLGGQNLIEAAACGCPVVMGPHTFNFAEAAELSLEAGAARRVADLEQAVPLACALVAAPAEREAMSRQAVAFATAHRGAARTMAQRIAALVAPRLRAPAAR
ncbi:lipid IV(A) 3-deoxy-D-manno-octulosonic acid transferase [Caldimonas thermodepolymerans]|uniref:lipid IV(A) 3-deoxy-D-manno-octulosonic acid transferase n=1 Tax=Caldimonas thermodepolymerans TaxID=215580 RepID=UPI003AFA30F7